MLEKITSDMKEAMKAKDKVRLNAIRMFRAALKDREIELGQALSEQDVVQMAGRLIKQRRDAASQYREAGRDDLAAKEEAEIGVLMAYMPAQMDEATIAEAVRKAVADTGASSMKDMGKVMGALKALQGQADMAVVSAQVKQALQG